MLAHCASYSKKMLARQVIPLLPALPSCPASACDNSRMLLRKLLTWCVLTSRYLASLRSNSVMDRVDCFLLLLGYFALLTRVGFLFLFLPLFQEC